jgi:hypothetical protein
LPPIATQFSLQSVVAVPSQPSPAVIEQGVPKTKSTGHSGADPLHTHFPSSLHDVLPSSASQLAVQSAVAVPPQPSPPSISQSSPTAKFAGHSGADALHTHIPSALHDVLPSIASQLAVQSFVAVPPQPSPSSISQSSPTERVAGHSGADPLHTHFLVDSSHPASVPIEEQPHSNVNVPRHPSLCVKVPQSSPTAILSGHDSSFRDCSHVHENTQLSHSTVPPHESVLPSGHCGATSPSAQKAAIAIMKM